MTEHRITDLSYGHLGIASYNISEQRWRFSQAFNDAISFQQILPSEQSVPPTLFDVTKEETEPPSVILQRQLRHISKDQPETHPAEALIANSLKISLSKKSDASSRYGTLLAFGHALDTDRVAGSARRAARRPQILAFSCGKAGHILQLALPRRDLRAWGTKSQARLSTLNSAMLEQGYWSGRGSPIHQVVFCEDETGSGNWLAARQAQTITVFRPMYGKPVSVTGPSLKITRSLLNPNPVASLSTKIGAVAVYADVSFNPWYTRQFAVVDSQGSWQLYNLERRHDKAGSEKIVAAGHGRTCGEEVGYSAVQSPSSVHSDGWYRILWICNAETILICDRRHLVLFNIGAEPTRLASTKLMAEHSADWILDIKLCSTDKRHLFVLTTSRILWVEVGFPVESSIQRQHSAGLKVILSSLHFRDPGDLTMRLTSENAGSFSAIIFSSKSSLVNVYHFGISDGVPSARQSSFSTRLGTDLMCPAQAICLTPCHLNALPVQGADKSEARYMEDRIHFYQLWLLGTDLSIHTGLYAATTVVRNGERPKKINPPDKSLLKSRQSDRQIHKGPWIVPDILVVKEPPHFIRARTRCSQRLPLLDSNGQALNMRLNWEDVFQATYSVRFKSLESQHHFSKEESQSLPQIFEHVIRAVEQNQLAISTIGEIASSIEVMGDLHTMAPLFQKFLGSLGQHQGQDGLQRLILWSATDCPSFNISQDQNSQHPELLRTYDNLVDRWIGSLPAKVSNPARGSKFKIIRRLALDLCLNSVVLFLQNRAATLPETYEASKRRRIPTDDGGDTATQMSSPMLFSTQLTAASEFGNSFRLLTPDPTPSLYSQTTSRFDLPEDAAILRLRQYVPSITAKADFEKPSFLAHWPSEPGADPSLYSYQATQKAIESFESGDESGHHRRHEEAQRRRRTEKFSKQERSRTVEAASRAAALPSGSQPRASRDFYSSQTVDDVPIARSDRSAFDSRLVHGGKRGRRKKNTAGFR